MLDFYGFNGLRSKYNIDTEKTNRAFYRMSQRQLRIMADFKGRFLIDNLNWLGSYNFFNYNPDKVNFDKLNKNTDPSDPDYLDGTSLYGKYKDWGLINPEESDGSNVHAFKIGLIYDTRNVLINHESGICTEAVVEIAPEFLNELPYNRYSIVHRQYHSIIKEKLNLAIRVGAQGKIGNQNIPFFRMPQLISPFLTRSNVTGLGGANSLRGILRNRIVSEGFAFGNFELRWRALEFSLLNQNFYLGVNGFVDAGIVTDEVDWNLTQLTFPEVTEYFDLNEGQLLHTSLGGGLKIGMNENFVISLDAGRALDKRDASKTGIYININYLF